MSDSKKKVLIHCGFLESLEDFTASNKKRIRQTIKKLQTQFNTPGLRPHKVANGFISFSASMAIRIIAKAADDGVVLLHVAQHKPAYQWADRHKLISSDSGVFELFSIKDSSDKEELRTKSPENTYGQELASSLKSIGVPIEIIKQLEHCKDEDHLLGRIELMSEDWQELVLAVASGDEPSSYTIPSKSSLVHTMSEDQELEDALTKPFAKWRLFLHPRQIKVVENRARVLSLTGGPGTGKTVVIAHRAVHLAHTLKQGEVVVVFGLNVALVNYLRNMIGELEPQKKYNSRRIWSMPMDNVDFKGSQDRTFSSPSKDLKVVIDAGSCYLVSDKWSKRIGAILVDEAQDCRQSFLSFLRSVLDDTDCNHLVLAHDANQTIFQTPRSKSGHVALSDLLEDATHFDLPFCFRMTKPLLVNAFEILGSYLLKESDRLETVETSRVPVATINGPKVAYRQVSDAKQLVTKTRELVVHLRKRYKKDDVAVIHLQYGSPHFFAKNRTDPVTDALKSDSVIKEHYHFGMWIKGHEFVAGVVVCPSNFMQRKLERKDLLLRLNTMFVAMTRFRDELHVVYESEAPAARYWPE